MKNTADKKRFRCALRAAVFLVAAFLPAVAGAASVEFLRVVDGDSLVAADGEKIRLSCIDAPEYDQPGGAAARAWLKTMTRGGVKVRRLGRDRYGRTLALLRRRGGDSIGLEMVRAGRVWVYRKYARVGCGIPLPDLCRAETKARAEARGLWRNPNPIPPNYWRRHRRAPSRLFFPPCEE